MDDDLPYSTGNSRRPLSALLDRLYARTHMPAKNIVYGASAYLFLNRRLRCGAESTAPPPSRSGERGGACSIVSGASRDTPAFRPGRNASAALSRLPLGRKIWFAISHTMRYYRHFTHRPSSFVTSHTPAVKLRHFTHRTSSLHTPNFVTSHTEYGKTCRFNPRFQILTTRPESCNSILTLY